jgi:hypothetical protein
MGAGLALQHTLEVVRMAGIPGRLPACAPTDRRASKVRRRLLGILVAEALGGELYIPSIHPGQSTADPELTDEQIDRIWHGSPHAQIATFVLKLCRDDIVDRWYEEQERKLRALELALEMVELEAPAIDWRSGSMSAG